MKEVQLLWVYSSQMESGFGVNSHTHDYYHLISMIDGMMQYTLGGKRFLVASGDVVLAPQGVVHAFENKSESPIRYYEIKFTVLNQGLKMILSSMPDYHLQDPFISRLASCIVEEYQNPRTGRDDSATSALLTMLYYMTRDVRCAGDSESGPLDVTAYSPLAQKVVVFLSKHYAEDLSLDDVSDGVGITKNYLCNAFRKSTGFTIMECLTAIRIRKAAELIVYSDLSLTQVAESCGYVSPSHFNRIFTRYVGLPPGQCRRAYTSQNLARDEEGQRHTDAFMFSVLAGKSISPGVINEFLSRKGKGEV